jgi:hypothetical protein
LAGRRITNSSTRSIAAPWRGARAAPPATAAAPQSRRESLFDV